MEPHQLDLLAASILITSYAFLVCPLVGHCLISMNIVNPPHNKRNYQDKLFIGCASHILLIAIKLVVWALVYAASKIGS